MKKTKQSFAIVVLLAGAISGHAQGELFFNLYSADLKQSIWGPQSLAASTYAVTYADRTVGEAVGSTSAGPEIPKGTTVYSGTGLSGAGYDIQLLAGPAGITHVGGTVGGVGLTPVSSIFHFKTSTPLLGYMSGNQPVTLPNEPYFSQGDQVSLAIAVWDNQGGTVNSLLDAVLDTPGNPYGVSWGISPVVTTTYAGGLPVSPVPGDALPTTLESFSLSWSDAPVVPEPGTITLGVIGAGTLLFRRRKSVS